MYEKRNLYRLHQPAGGDRILDYRLSGWTDADVNGLSGAAGDRGAAVWIGCAGCLVDSGCQSEREEAAWKKISSAKKKKI